MLVSFTFRLARECTACKMSLPINGIVEEVRCYHCGEVNPLGAAFWTFAIEREYFATALAGADGEATESQVISKHGNYTLAYGKRAPRCQACKGPDLDVAALPAFAGAGRCFCPACGHSIRVRAADALVRAVNDRAALVVHETAALGGDAAIEARTTPVLFQCMGCGGGLRVDGTSRAVTCTFCSASNYLPDGLWRQLNPVPRPQVFFLLCDYDSLAARDLRWNLLEARTEDAGSPSADVAALFHLAQDDDEDVREAVAGNPATPPATLIQLAADRASDVRARVAANLATPLPGLLRLAEDRDDDVIGALCARGDLPAEVCAQLAAHPDDDTRELIAAHPNLPFEALHQLAKDDDEDVKEAARRRLRELRDQGVDVGGGFFSKLFGN